MDMRILLRRNDAGTTTAHRFCQSKAPCAVASSPLGGVEWSRESAGAHRDLSPLGVPARRSAPFPSRRVLSPGSSRCSAFVVAVRRKPSGVCVKARIRQDPLGPEGLRPSACCRLLRFALVICFGAACVLRFEGVKDCRVE